MAKTTKPRSNALIKHVAPKKRKKTHRSPEARPQEPPIGFIYNPIPGLVKLPMYGPGLDTTDPLIISDDESDSIGDLETF